jgi:hypothetical protein
MTYCENLLVRNNIFFSDNANKVHLFYQDNNGSGNAIDYNFYMSLNGKDDCLFTYDGNGYSTFEAYQNATGGDANSGYGNPLFTDVGSFDFSLQSGSPAIDAGDPNFVAGQDETDFAGISRVMDVVDCGAFEYDKTISVDELSIHEVLVYPVPASSYLKIEGIGNVEGVEVYSIDGQRISGIKYEQGNMNIEHLQAGLYVLRIKVADLDQIHQLLFVKH